MRKEYFPENINLKRRSKGKVRNKTKRLKLKAIVRKEPIRVNKKQLVFFFRF